MYLQRRENHLHRGVEAKRGEMSTDQPRGREWSLGPIQTGRKRRLAIKLQRRFLRAGLVGSRQFSLLFFDLWRKRIPPVRWKTIQSLL